MSRADDDGRLDHLSHEAEKPIAELLVYVALELRSLCTAANIVEASVEDIIGDHPSNRPETLAGLQELDRLIQHMDGLADYLAALAEASRGAGVVDPTDARRVLKLARLRDQLTGGPEDGAGGGDSPDAGEIEFL